MPLPETRSRICNLVPSRATERDWTFDDAVGSRVFRVAPLPNAVDLRQSWWRIGDQRDTGSCVGWATADGVVRYHLVNNKKLAKNQELSVRFVWMAAKELDVDRKQPSTFIETAGTSLKSAVDVCRKYGVVTADTLRFDIHTVMYTGPEHELFVAAAQRKIGAYFNLRKDLTRWKHWLASHGPILAGVAIDHTWDRARSTKGRLDRFMPSTVRGGHAIVVVGYTGTGRFIVRSSWGTRWGDNGYAYVSPAYITKAFFDESYGVTM